MDLNRDSYPSRSPPRERDRAPAAASERGRHFDGGQGYYPDRSHPHTLVVTAQHQMWTPTEVAATPHSAPAVMMHRSSATLWTDLHALFASLNPAHIQDPCYNFMETLKGIIHLPMAPVDFAELAVMIPPGLPYFEELLGHLVENIDGTLLVPLDARTFMDPRSYLLEMARLILIESHSDTIAALIESSTEMESTRASFSLKRGNKGLSLQHETKSPHKPLLKKNDLIRLRPCDPRGRDAVAQPKVDHGVSLWAEATLCGSRSTDVSAGITTAPPPPRISDGGLLASATSGQKPPARTTAAAAMGGIGCHHTGVDTGDSSVEEPGIETVVEVMNVIPPKADDGEIRDGAVFTYHLRIVSECTAGRDMASTPLNSLVQQKNVGTDKVGGLATLRRQLRALAAVVTAPPVGVEAAATDAPPASSSLAADAAAASAVALTVPSGPQVSPLAPLARLVHPIMQKIILCTNTAVLKDLLPAECEPPLMDREDFIKFFADNPSPPVEPAAHWRGMVSAILNCATLRCQPKGLNEYQKLAAQRALTQTFTVVRGPPGTGKTSTAVATILTLLRLRENNVKILITADSNAAVDNILQAFIFEVAPAPGSNRTTFAVPTMQMLTGLVTKEIPVRIARAGIASDSHRGLQSVTADSQADCLDCTVLDIYEMCNVIFATTSAAASLPSKLQFSMLILDEGGQLTEPSTLTALVCGARCVVLFGDEKQLGPTVKNPGSMVGGVPWLMQPQFSRELFRTGIAALGAGAGADALASTRLQPSSSSPRPPEPLPDAHAPRKRGPSAALTPRLSAGGSADRFLKEYGLQLSLFDRLVSTVPDTAITLLKVQYRMSPELLSFVNKYIYKNELKTGVSRKERMPPLCFGWPRDSTNQPVGLAFVNHDFKEEASGTSFRNREEAKKIVTAVQHFLKSGIEASAIGIITGYAPQRDLLRLGAPCSVGTVDSFQGSQRDILLISMVRCNDEPDARNALGFLLKQRRLNVMLTRARRAVIIVGSRRTAERESGNARNLWRLWLQDFSSIPNTTFSDYDPPRQPPWNPTMIPKVEPAPSAPLAASSLKPMPLVYCAASPTASSLAPMPLGDCAPPAPPMLPKVEAAPSASPTASSVEPMPPVYCAAPAPVAQTQVNTVAPQQREAPSEQLRDTSEDEGAERTSKLQRAASESNVENRLREPPHPSSRGRTTNCLASDGEPPPPSSRGRTTKRLAIDNSAVKWMSREAQPGPQTLDLGTCLPTCAFALWLTKEVGETPACYCHE